MEYGKYRDPSYFKSQREANSMYVGMTRVLYQFSLNRIRKLAMLYPELRTEFSDIWRMFCWDATHRRKRDPYKMLMLRLQEVITSWADENGGRRYKVKIDRVLRLSEVDSEENNATVAKGA